MSLASIERMFSHVRQFIKQWEKKSERHELNFIWHGGEPLAQPLSYWKKILAVERRVFAGDENISIVRDLQTNLTLVTMRHLSFLRQFQVGFSYDVVNDLRVNAAGMPTGDVVARAAGDLRAKGVRLGAICVVSKANVEHAREIADFFLSRGLTFKALPVYRALDTMDPVREAAVPFDRYIAFLHELLDLPEVSAAVRAGKRIDPLWSARDLFERWSRGYQTPYSVAECNAREWALMVNTNGDVFSPGDTYDPNLRYGNIFTQTFDDFLFSSDGRAKRIRRSAQRLQEVCGDCFLFRRGCDGTYVSHATPEEYREFNRNHGCHYKTLAERFRVEARASAPIHRCAEGTLYLNITYRCNSRCLFCAADVAYKKEPRKMTLDDMKRLIGNKHYDEIQLSGGEPSIHPDIIEAVEHCRAHASRVSILTHGRTLQNATFAERLLASGITAFVIPLYGPDSESHHFVSGVKGSFDQTVRGFENLERLRDRYRFTVVLKFLLTRYTAPLNRSIYQFSRSRFPRGFDQISICPLIYSQSTLDHGDAFAAPFAELKHHLFSLVEEIGRDGDYPLILTEFPPCFFPTSKSRHDAHPTLHAPVNAHSISYGDDRTPAEIRMDSNALDFHSNVKGNVLIESCHRCRHREYCSEKQTPYFSSTYLRQFGESEFHPLL
jgi:uncharacterized protein